jgi:RNA polymerase sigma-70 factor (ECF subfamily)
MTYPDDYDQHLVRTVANGDIQAMDVLYERHGLGVLNYLVGQLGDRQQAEEILQDVMLAVWKGAASFRGDSQVRTWLLGIARHRALNARQRRRPASLPLDEDINLVEEPHDTLEESARQMHVQRGLRQLTADQRETLELIFYHGLTGSEAAAVMGVSPGTVKSRLHRAKAALRDLLGKEEANG